MLDEINQTKQKFKLKMREEPVGPEISSRLGEIWVILQELRPKELSEYGKLSDIDRDSLGPHVTVLMKMVKQAQDSIS